jgi:glycosyltransferase involved in cell wall biosynthesis
MSLPLVTLVTPTFNQINYVAETLNSVLAQTDPNVEYIVVNDGSTDGTQGILNHYKERCTVIHQSNSGQAQTLNRAWAGAKGEIIGYLSSDDLLNPEAITKSVQALLTTPGSVACYCDFQLIDSNGHPGDIVCKGEFSDRILVEDLVCQPGPGAFFYKEAFMKAGMWNPTLHQLPDFDFWLRLSRLGTFVRIPEVLAYYRVHTESASYRPVSIERAEEIVNVMEGFWVDHPDTPFQRSLSLATSHLFAGNNHLRSGRLKVGTNQLLKSARLNPRLFLRFLTWRMIAANMIKHFRNVNSLLIQP